MPMVIKTSQHRRLRILISGFSMSGKTHSLKTFIYGPYDVDDPEEYDAAIEYAEQQGKHMVILSCPGEAGTRTLPEANKYITPIFFEVENPEVMSTRAWSQQALADFEHTEQEVIRNKPDILVYDGIHGLAIQLMNDISQGEFLSGVDMDLNPTTGKMVQFRGGRYYSRLDNTFGQRIAGIYAGPSPLIICTCQEKWKGAQSDSERPRDASATRYLWPNIPGDMATRVVGMFDARISARLENTCIFNTCDDRRSHTPHYVWQFAPSGDVIQAGIKGLHMRKEWRATPFIHQNWVTLKQLIGVKDE